MSESRNSATNSLDAESGVSVKSCVSRGRRLLEALFPWLEKSRLEGEAYTRRIMESWRIEREEQRTKLRAMAKAVTIKSLREEVWNRPASSRRTYRRIKEKT